MEAQWCEACGRAWLGRSGAARLRRPSWRRDRAASRHVASRRGLTGAMSTPEAPSSRVDSGEGGGRRHGGGFGRRKFPEECKEAKLKLELCYAENMTGFFFIPCRVSFLSSASLACRRR